MAQGGPPWSERKDKAFFRGSMYCHSGFPHRIQGAASQQILDMMTLLNLPGHWHVLVSRSTVSSVEP